MRGGDEAVGAARKALRKNPTSSMVYRCLAVAFAHLGREEETREAVARLLDSRPISGLPNGLAAPAFRNDKYSSTVCARHDFLNDCASRVAVADSGHRSH